MAGTSSDPLSCSGFIESDLYVKSRELIEERFDVDTKGIDDRLEALIEALRRNAEEMTARVPNRKLWVGVTDDDFPPRLRLYLRPRPDVPSECELMWVEDS